MSRKSVSYGGALLLAWTVVLAAPSLARAQHGGGGHGGGGGGHMGGGGFGGGHMGGGYAGGFHGGGNFGGGHLGGGYAGGYHGGGNLNGYRGGIYGGGAYNNGFRHYGSYGYRYPYYGSYGYGYPYYGTYGYGYPYYGSYGYDYYPYDDNTYSYPNYDSGYAGSAADGVATAAPAAGTYPTLPLPARGTYQSDTNAHITVKLPADARIWFDGTATTATGAVREFDSPLLTPGNRHTYEVRARWTENGQEVTQSQQVEVTAGAHVNVEFPTSTQTAAQAPAATTR